MIVKKLKRKAKKISLEVWAYLRDHPDIVYKEDLPKKIYSKIQYIDSECPLCDLFGYIECRGCPLKKISRCDNKTSYWKKWNLSRTDKTRAKYASLLHDAIEGWVI